jgi:hypothetical protein
VIASRAILGRVVGWLGLSIGLTVAVAVPAGYLLVAWSELAQELSLLSEIKATRLAKYIYVHQELWQYQTIRLAELIEVPEAKGLITQHRIVDAAGTLVLETGEAAASPNLWQGAPIMVSGSQLATIQTATTLRGVQQPAGLCHLSRHPDAAHAHHRPGLCPTASDTGPSACHHRRAPDRVHGV